jgi:hypothetical protein
MLDNYKKNLIEKIIAEFNQNTRLLVNKYNLQLRQILSRRSRRNRFIINRLNYSFNQIYKASWNDLQRKIKIIEQTPSIVSDNITKNNKKALLVGINYTGTNNQLNGCINDVLSIEKYLKEFTCTMLTDNTIMKPTGDNILSEFTELLKKAVIGDILFFAFSGHGSYIKDNNNEELDGNDELIYPIDGNYITDDKFKQIIDTHLKVGVTLFALFDSCNSGTMLDLRYNFLTDESITNYENSKNNETTGNVYMISGCKDNQYSIDGIFNGKRNGALTWAFLECIKSNQSWKVLVNTMRTRLAEGDYGQVPQLSSGKQIDINNNHNF